VLDENGLGVHRGVSAEMQQTRGHPVVVADMELAPVAVYIGEKGSNQMLGSGTSSEPP
jgi:hypothetical protein